MAEKDMRKDDKIPRCTICTNRDLCNRRAYTLEIIKLFVTPKMVFAIMLLILTIMQFITGG